MAAFVDLNLITFCVIFYFVYYFHNYIAIHHIKLFQLFLDNSVLAGNFIHLVTKKYSTTSTLTSNF